jgi:hypothetical protein
MAYAASGLSLIGPSGTNPRMWVYATTDDRSDVLAADYFTDGDLVGLSADDIVMVVNTDDGSHYTTTVSSVTAGGVATVAETNKSQELTASGAVIPGVSSVELNHATVVVAATIADAADHTGLFVVKDTSASGTAAHTLTLTAGTFDGTNNVATLNAPNECLIVWFDSAGAGTIVENVGTVALS